MSFDKRITERIPKRDDICGYPLKNCPKCGSNDLTYFQPDLLLQDHPHAEIRCNQCGYYLEAPLWTIVVGIWNYRQEYDHE
jgi:DNA-directed RNA polymerase subunit M/transcription elongation factor TFIIS